MRLSLSGSPSIAEKVESAGGQPSGFDYLRIILAVGVLITHIPQLTHGSEGPDIFYRGPLRPLMLTILPMFFALSGFLVAGSLERTRTLGAFIGLRMIRIYPALAVEVLLSALLLGPIITSVALSEYFTHPDFFIYLLNVTGEIHYNLPGVFLDSPAGRAVNAQLWTIPFELLCYVSISLLAIIGLKKRPYLAPLIAVLFTLAVFIYSGVKNDWNGGRANFGSFLVWSFLWGVTFYVYRRKVIHSPVVFAVVAILGLVSLKLEGYWTYLTPVFLAYATVYLGSLNPAKNGLLRGADYSYGIFLYHWVVIQTIYEYVPREWYWGLLLGLPLSTLVAMLSWRFIEKPALALRRPIMAADKAGTPNLSIWAVRAVAALVIVYMVYAKLFA